MILKWDGMGSPPHSLPRISGLGTTTKVGWNGWISWISWHEGKAWRQGPTLLTWPLTSFSLLLPTSFSGAWGRRLVSNGNHPTSLVALHNCIATTHQIWFNILHCRQGLYYVWQILTDIDLFWTPGYNNTVEQRVTSHSKSRTQNWPVGQSPALVAFGNGILPACSFEPSKLIQIVKYTVRLCRVWKERENTCDGRLGYTTIRILALQTFSPQKHIGPKMRNCPHTN